MAYTTRIAYDTLRSIDSATFTGSYQALGSRLQNGSYILKLVNNSNVLVTVSIDGVNDHDIAPAGSFFLYDEAKTVGQERFPANTQFFVKGSAGVGLVYLVNQYLVVG